MIKSKVLQSPSGIEAHKRRAYFTFAGVLSASIVIGKIRSPIWLLLCLYREAARQFELKGQRPGLSRLMPLSLEWNLTHPKTSPLAIRSKKSSFVKISRLHRYCLLYTSSITWEENFKPWFDNSVNRFVKVISWILTLDCKSVGIKLCPLEEQLILSNRGKFSSCSQLTIYPHDNAWIFNLREYFIWKCSLFSRASRESTVTQSSVSGLWAATDWVFGTFRLKSRLSRVTRTDVDRGWVWIHVQAYWNWSGVLHPGRLPLGNDLARNICFFDISTNGSRLLVPSLSP